MIYLMNNAKILVTTTQQKEHIPPHINDLIIHANLQTLGSICADLTKDENKRTLEESRIQKIAANNHQAIAIHRALQSIGGQGDTMSMTSSSPSDAPVTIESTPTDNSISRLNPTPLKLNIYAGDHEIPGCINCSTIAGYPSDVILDLSSKTLVNTTLHTATYGDITLAENQFDEIVLNDVLATTHDLIATMTNCLNLLKIGGELKISVPYDLSHAAWENPLNIRAFNERSWDIYTVNYEQLGWTEACFTTSAMDVMFSPLGEELMTKEDSIAHVLAQPRAVDQLQIVLTKCAVPAAHQNQRLAA